jgi:hypothetical protein
LTVGGIKIVVYSEKEKQRYGECPFRKFIEQSEKVAKGRNYD